MVADRNWGLASTAVKLCMAATIGTLLQQDRAWTEPSRVGFQNPRLCATHDAHMDDTTRTDVCLGVSKGGHGRPHPER